MHKDFNLGILMNMSDKDTDDEIVQMLLDAVPNIGEFKKVYIEEEQWYAWWNLTRYLNCD